MDRWRLDAVFYHLFRGLTNIFVLWHAPSVKTSNVSMAQTGIATYICVCVKSLVCVRNIPNWNTGANIISIWLLYLCMAENVLSHKIFHKCLKIVCGFHNTIINPCAICVKRITVKWFVKCHSCIASIMIGDVYEIYIKDFSFMKWACICVSSHRAFIHNGH